MLKFDHIIVGAGSAGCVLAARLSEDSERKVLLLEAGGSNWDPLIHIPLTAGHLVRTATHNWLMTAEPSPGSNNRRVPYPRGKVLGGTSSINGMVYIRGNAQDYDEIAALGNRSWSYREVLPYFKRSENHQSRSGEYHGTQGPLKVTTGTRENPLYDAFLAAGDSCGYPATDDFNGAQQEGLGRYDFTIFRGRRQSTAVAFLQPASNRQNLQVRTHAMAKRILIERGVARGVEFIHNGKVEVAHADEVTVCGGALHSPHLLMLSGIGDPQWLRQAGVDVVHELPGVGKNLREHARVLFQFKCLQPVSLHRILRADRMALALAQAMVMRSGPAAHFAAQVGGFTKVSPTDAVPEAQWFCFLGSGIDGLRWPWTLNKGQESFGMTVVLLRPDSIGEVRLKSANPADLPAAAPNLLGDDRDLERLVSLAQQMDHLSRQSSFNGLNGGNLSGADALRTQADWKEWVRNNVITSQHPVGTCRMGHDSMAVVDDTLRVHGIKGLRVVDASVLPLVPRGNTNAPTIMVAEKAADFIRGRTSNAQPSPSNNERTVEAARA